MKLIFATRPSPLARAQTKWVVSHLLAAWPDLEAEEKLITTSGDRNLHTPLPEIGGKGLFTTELESELHSGRVHAAVHSLKDLPVEDSPGLVIGAVPARSEVRDVLVSGKALTLDTLPEGAVVGTSSLRRSAQLLAYRPDLRLQPVRGNVDTRLRKAQQGYYDAVILAGAGLERLGFSAQISQWLPLEIMLPAPGQGALAVQCRSDDPDTLHLLAAIDDATTHTAVSAERAFLQALGGGCAVPIAAHAVSQEGLIQLTGLVISLDGRTALRVSATGSDPAALGRQLAHEALQQGASQILLGIKRAGQP